MTQPKVYLAGPITGLSYDGAQDWRKIVADQLRPIHCLTPLRGKEYLRDVKGGLSGTGEEYAHLGPLSLPRGVMTRDRWDATRCDVLFVNLLGATRVSIGTVMEIAWADLRRTPIVCCMEQGNVHEHMMLAEALGYRVDRLSDACDIVRSLLDVPTNPPAMEWPAEPEVRFPPTGEFIGLQR